MIKLLHTSDLHLGHTLYDYDREQEQVSMLQQIAEICKTEQIDVLLICGDIFHTASPGAHIQKLFNDTIINLHLQCPNICTVIIVGNHDSASRQEAYTNLWKKINVHLLGNIDKDNYNKQIITIPNKGIIVAVPYTNERNLPNNYYKNVVTHAKQNTSLPIILMGHTTVKGADFLGHQQINNDCIGGIDATEIQNFGEDYTYFALGHIHKPQFIHTGKHNVRYSGSPIAISFDETYPHSVTIVNINDDKTINYNYININNPRPLVSLPSQGYAKWEDAKELLKNYPNDIPAYIRLNVEIEDFLPTDALHTAKMLCTDKACTLCYINQKRKDNNTNNEVKLLSVQELQQIPPLDLARLYMENTNNEFTPKMQELFKEVLNEINKDERYEN